MSDQGVYRVAKVAGDVRRGEDDDGEPVASGESQKVIQIENSYFEKLKSRLAQSQPKADTGEPASGDPGSGGITGEPEKKNPGFVVYGDDGMPIK